MKNLNKAKKIVLLILILFNCYTAVAQYAEQIRVLFVGNSYTAVNNLPEMLRYVAKSTTNDIYIESNTPGGCTFQMHTTNNSANLIKIGNWDYVILQEQSQLPALDSLTFFTQSYPYSKQLDSLIVNNNDCCETVFYMTWGRENGDDEFCPIFPPVCTYEGMDDLLYNRYMLMANDNSAIVSPVGAVWREIRKTHPEIDLYSSDGSHPSLSGSYAAACTFYTVILRKDPTLITYYSSLPEDEAENIRKVVKNVVFNDLLRWNVGKYDKIITRESDSFPFSIYPNPSNGQFTIETDLLSSDNYTVSIYTSSGNLVKSFKYSNLQKEVIDVRGLQSGLYMLVITSNSGVMYTKMINIC